MNFEDRFRALLQRADRSMPDGSLSYQAVISKARRDRNALRMAVGLAAAAAVVGAGFATASALRDSDPAPLPPANTDSPAPSETPTPESTEADVPDPLGDCSAVILLGHEAKNPQDPQSELPAVVQDMRQRIIDAALQCDYERLTELALEGRRYFSYSFGVTGDPMPGDYWRQTEKGKVHNQEPVLRLLVQTLDLSYCTQRLEDPDGEGMVTQYVWPSADCDTPTDEQWAEVAPLYDAEVMEAMKESGIGFTGYRVGILEDGDWIFYIAGD